MASLHTSAERGRQFSQKFTCARYFTALCTNCVGAGDSSYGAYFEGHTVLQNVHSTSAVCAYIWPPGGAQCDRWCRLCRKLRPPHAEFWGLTPILWMPICRDDQPLQYAKSSRETCPPFLLYKSSKMSPFFHSVRHWHLCS